MKIRKMIESDTKEVFEMMKVFYNSPAVLSNGSDEIFKTDIENCINDCPYLEGYVFVEDDHLLGYAMVAKSFSTEFGKTCLWIEDLYMKAEYRGQGIGTKFFEYIENQYSNCIIRLEVEEENQGAVHTYQKCGYDFLEYKEMKKIIE